MSSPLLRSLDDVALLRHLPQLRGTVPWVRLGAWPTPVEPLPALIDPEHRRCPVYVKREDQSNPLYGGNKIRTLEPVLGQALDRGATTVWSTGAYGSNHALATALHAPTLGLRAGAALFPQPSSGTARANARALLGARPALVLLRNVVELPVAMALLRQRRGAFVMAPGAVSPLGTFGALSAGLELAEQVAVGACPTPARIVLPVGSTCTTAGLLVGLHLAAYLGIAFADRVPTVIAVRITPWPVTSALRIVHLAFQAVRELAHRSGQRLPIHRSQLRASLRVESRYLGGGYGCATAAGYRAAHGFRAAGGPPLDAVYSAKSGAALIELGRRGGRGPVLFWATKSSAPLPCPDAAALSTASPRLHAWLACT